MDQNPDELIHKWIDIHQKLTSTFNQNLTFVVRIELDGFRGPKLESEFESDVAIQFESTNRPSLPLTLSPLSLFQSLVTTRTLSTI